MCSSAICDVLYPVNVAVINVKVNVNVAVFLILPNTAAAFPTRTLTSFSQLLDIYCVIFIIS